MNNKRKMKKKNVLVKEHVAGTEEENVPLAFCLYLLIYQ
jgi:hypothetical protein